MSRHGLVVSTIIIFLFVTVIPLAQASDRGQWRVTALPSTGGWFEGQAAYRPRSILNRPGAFGKGYYSIYLLDLSPDSDYTLGLRYPADSANKPSVTIFDRWPLIPEAKRYKLPMGPVVRTHYEKIEYRWRLGVSGRSQGRLAFVVVEAKPGFIGSSDDFRHFIYLTTPAISPIHEVGEGITYLRGPSELFLPQSADIDQYIVEYPYGRIDSHNDRDNQHGSVNNLINNGDFAHGLAGWQIFPVDARGVGVFDGKLRLWSNDTSAVSGVKQRVEADVTDHASLQLSMDIMISAQTEPSGPGSASPLALTICYEDRQRIIHCGDKAFRKKFTTQPGYTQSQQLDVVFLPIKEWFRYTFELENLNPELLRLISIELSGNGAPERDVWVKNISILR